MKKSTYVRPKRLSAARLSAALVSASLMPAAFGAGLEEVIVTAQKREESLQETPISLQVFDNQQLETKGINNIADLQTNVPSLQIAPHPNSAATSRIYMRGIGNSDDQVTQDGSVAVYMDGIYIARSQGLAMDIADIQRIEVLRGPQGTLYGRNATGGAINYISVEPNLNSLEFKQQVTLGNRDLLRAKSSINLPLGETVAARLSFLRVKQDGFIDNEGSGVDRFGDTDRTAWRADVLWQPLDNLSIRYAYDRSNIDDTPTFFAAAPFYPQQADRPTKGSPSVRDLDRNDIVAQGHSLTATWDIDDNLTLKSLTAFRNLDNSQNEDFLTGIPASKLVPVQKNNSRAYQNQLSQEFQLIGDTMDRRLEYTLGAYFLREQGRNASNSATNTALLYGLDPVAVANATSITWQPATKTTFENRAYAVFGQGTWTPPVLEDKLHITAGARWSKDQREAMRLAFNTTTRQYEQGEGDRSYNNFSPSLVVAYDLNSDMNVYGKIVRGYKTGGFNIRASSTERFEDGFAPEKLTSYELGLKSQLFDNRIRFNTAIFLADYDDIQFNLQSNPLNARQTDVLNAGKATIKGLETELTALLFTGLTLNLNYSYLHASYDDVQQLGRDTSAQYRFINTPNHSYAVDLSYQFPSLPFGELSADIGYAWQDNIFAAPQVNRGRYVIDDYGLLNARLTLSNLKMLGGDMRVALWGKNLRDEEYYTSLFQLNGGNTGASFGAPRSYGVDFIYQY